jgi:hypothetical protein
MNSKYNFIGFFKNLANVSLKSVIFISDFQQCVGYIYRMEGELFMITLCYVYTDVPHIDN